MDENLASEIRMYGDLGDWLNGPWVQGETADGTHEVVHKESGTVIATLPGWAGSIALWMCVARDAMPALTSEVIPARWDRTVIHPDAPNGDIDGQTIVCCIADDGTNRPIGLFLDDEDREALGLQLVDPNGTGDLPLDVLRREYHEARARIAELEAELGIGTPWKCPVCSKENTRDVCAICETDRPDDVEDDLP